MVAVFKVSPLRWVGVYVYDKVPGDKVVDEASFQLQIYVE
jgi:hypothetical protein